MHIRMYVYIYIYTHRERDVCIYIYIYIYLMQYNIILTYYIIIYLRRSVFFFTDTGRRISYGDLTLISPTTILGKNIESKHNP